MLSKLRLVSTWPYEALRAVIFWMHLAAGTTAGVVILIMSVTGVALTYEKQMIERADRRPGRRRPRPTPGIFHQRRCWRK